MKPSLDIIKKFYVLTNWRTSELPLKNNIKIYIKTAPTCFGVTVTPSSGSELICQILLDETVFKQHNWQLLNSATG